MLDQNEAIDLLTDLCESVSIDVPEQMDHEDRATLERACILGGAILMPWLKTPSLEQIDGLAALVVMLVRLGFSLGYSAGLAQQQEPLV